MLIHHSNIFSRLIGVRIRKYQPCGEVGRRQLAYFIYIPPVFIMLDRRALTKLHNSNGLVNCLSRQYRLAQCPPMTTLKAKDTKPGKWQGGRFHMGLTKVESSQKYMSLQRGLASPYILGVWNSLLVK